jgi:hypothetical protein
MENLPGEDRADAQHAKRHERPRTFMGVVSRQLLSSPASGVCGLHAGCARSQSSNAKLAPEGEEHQAPAGVVSSAEMCRARLPCSIFTG